MRPKYVADHRRTITVDNVADTAFDIKVEILQSEYINHD